MPQYRVTFQPNSTLEPETIEADRVDVEGGGSAIVFRRQVLVIGAPRDVVVRRLSASEVADVAEA